MGSVLGTLQHTSEGSLRAQDVDRLLGKLVHNCYTSIHTHTPVLFDSSLHNSELYRVERKYLQAWYIILVLYI